MYRWLTKENIASLPESLQRAAEKNPKRTALIYSKSKFSYRDVASLVNKFAVIFKRLIGFTNSQERIAIFLPNLPQFVFSYYAASLANNSIVVPINFTSIVTELRRKPVESIKLKESVITELGTPIVDSSPKILVVADFLWPILEQLKVDGDIENIIVTSPADFLPFPLNILYKYKAKKEGRWVKIPKRDNIFFLKDLKKIYLNEKEVTKYPDLDSIAQLQYTGGTTGIPKGVMLSHRNVITNVLQSREQLGNSICQGVTVIGALPFFHVYGLTVCLNTTLLALRGTLVLVPAFDPRKIFDTIQNTGASLWPGVNRMFEASLAAKEIPRFHNLVCISGAGRLDQNVKESFEQKTGAKILEGYGLSEASPVVSVSLPSGNPIGSVGRPVPQTEIKIVDDTTGEELGPNKEGEIVVRGPQVMLGYYNKKEETREVLKEGWLHTGDIGKIDQNGMLFIVDRLKDMVKIDNENVYPQKIEKEILKEQGVKKCAIIGRKDKKKGEILIAYVVLEEGLTCQKLYHKLLRSLPSLWLPKQIIQVSQDQFSEWENAAIGKVYKRKIREFDKDYLNSKEEV